MVFISTGELAEKWRISESRIVRLAKAGRIPGARLVGKSWIFPPDAEKPEDGRRKENKAGARESTFRFPMYLYALYSKAELENSFSADERTLYEGERLFFRGAYQQCSDMLSPLSETTADRYVQFGALYHVCLASVYLRRCGWAFSVYNEIQALYLRETAHKAEIGFLIRNLESYFVGNSSYIENFRLDMQTPYPLHMREYLLLECAYSDMLKAQYKAVPVSPQPYEIVLQTDRDRFSPLAMLTMHLYLASICGSCGQSERSVYHVRESCRIAKAYDMEYAGVSFMSKYMLSTYKRALLGEDPAQLTRLRAISDDMFEAFSHLFAFAGKHSLLHILDSTDSMLVSFAIKEMTNKEIASVLHLSMNTVSKKYSVLLEKTGTHSKKELADWYVKTIRDY